jgi:hypothetical protein
MLSVVGDECQGVAFMSDAARNQIQSLPGASLPMHGVRMRMAVMALIWLPLGALVGALSMAESAGVISVFSGILAGMIVTPLLGVVLALLGGEIKPVLFGATSGALIGALSGALDGLGVSPIAGVGLIGGGIVGATLPAIMLRFKRLRELVFQENLFQ